jgi:hypothetical protein
MFRVHFGQACKLWTVDEVLDFAEEVGLDRADAAEALHDRRYRAQVDADQREAQRLGARGAPFLVIDGRYAIPGAVDTDQLLASMTRAWQDSHPDPEPLLVLAEADGVCGPDGCVVPQHTGSSDDVRLSARVEELDGEGALVEQPGSNVDAAGAAAVHRI